MFNSSVSLILLLSVTRFDDTLSFIPSQIRSARRFFIKEYFHCSYFCAKGDKEYGQEGRKEWGGTDGVPEFDLLDRSNSDFDQRPSRHMRKKERNEGELFKRPSAPKYATIESKFREWGVETIDDPSQQPICPNTIHGVAQAAFHAISSTLYHQNRLDPNIANNALAVAVTDKRPLAFAYWPEGRDVGRLGIEIDGLRYSMERSVQNSNNDENYCSLKSSVENELRPLPMKKPSHREIEMEGRALRKMSLVLASKLSTRPWDGLEYESNSFDPEMNLSETGTRPVALFFNTLRQALLASQELQLLQKISKSVDEKMQYDNVRILCLGDDDIPIDMTEAGTNDKKRKKRGRASALSKGTVNPHNGLILVVQPTDFNNEIKPPSPSVGTIHHLQRILARASIAQIPAIVISPRLTEQLHSSGIEQSGYQQSSTYGGVEPPKGPTPWILRDFATPVFSWVGNALEIARKPTSIATMNGTESTIGKVENEYVSRVVITQSVMDSGHPWHFFTVQENVQRSECKYRYVASTGTRAGRPSRQIICDVISEWC